MSSPASAGPMMRELVITAELSDTGRGDGHVSRTPVVPAADDDEVVGVVGDGRGDRAIERAEAFRDALEAAGSQR